MNPVRRGGGATRHPLEVKSQVRILPARQNKKTNEKRRTSHGFRYARYPYLTGMYHEPAIRGSGSPRRRISRTYPLPCRRSFLRLVSRGLRRRVIRAAEEGSRFHTSGGLYACSATYRCARRCYPRTYCGDRRYHYSVLVGVGIEAIALAFQTAHLYIHLLGTLR